MSTISGLVRNMLANDAGVTALVSTRIYPVVLPQTPTYPALVYQRISGPPRSGSSTFRQSRYQVDCWANGATGYGDATALAAAVVAAAEDYTAGAQLPAIRGTYTANLLDDYDPDIEAYRVIVDLIVSTTGD